VQFPPNKNKEHASGPKGRIIQACYVRAKARTYLPPQPDFPQNKKHASGPKGRIIQACYVRAKARTYLPPQPDFPQNKKHASGPNGRIIQACYVRAKARTYLPPQPDFRKIKSMPQGLKAESFRLVMYGLKPVPTCHPNLIPRTRLTRTKLWFSRGDKARTYRLSQR
jgi:hypothetical protein